MSPYAQRQRREADKYAAWLRSLQVGDKVAYDDGGHFDRRIRVEKILRLTNTQFITEDGRRFYRADGRIMGGSRFRTLKRVDDPDILKGLIEMTGRALSSRINSVIFEHGRAEGAQRAPWSELAATLEAEVSKAHTKLIRLEEHLAQELAILEAEDATEAAIRKCEEEDQRKYVISQYESILEKEEASSPRFEYDNVTDPSGMDVAS